MAEEKGLSIFEAVGEKERAEAVNNLLKGKTPISEVKEREGRGNRTYKYVNTYYMTRQIALLTGFRWTSHCLEERFYPDDKIPREIGAKMEVTIWDLSGNSYSQQSWGQKDVARYTRDDPKGNYKAGEPLSIFDDLKAAYSDGIKKCLSYFGIASDIYGGKELEFFATDETDTTTDFTGDDARKAFNKYIESIGLTYSKVFSILGVKGISDIKDYKEAYNTIVAKLKADAQGGDSGNEPAKVKK